MTGLHPSTHAGPPTWRETLTMPTLATVTALVTVVTSLGAPVIPSIAKADHVSLATAEWVLTSALVVGAVATPAMGRLSDGGRQRRVIEVALATTLVGCVLSAVSRDFALMVLGRCLQGCGFGLMPVTMAIARRQLRPERLSQAIATLSVTAAVGAGLGYPLTGFIAERFNFHVAYAVGAGMMAAVLVLSVAVLPSRTPGRAERFDVGGWLLLAAAIVAASVALSEGGEWGWSSPAVLGLLAAALGVGATWALHQLRAAAPLIDVRQVRHRSVLTADVAGFFGASAMYLYLPIMVEFVQVAPRHGYGFGASVFVSGCLYLPLSVTSYLGSRCLGLYERWLGPRTMVPLGLALFGAASATFGLAHSAIWEAFLSSSICGLGIGLSFAAIPGYIVRAVPASQTGAAMGLYSLGRAIGLSVGSAAAAAILAANTRPGAIFPSVRGFDMALVAGGALLMATGVFTYVAPGGLSGTGGRLAPQPVALAGAGDGRASLADAVASAVPGAELEG